MKTVKEIETAVNEYLIACYGGQSLGPAQIKEVRQAFLSGIHWRDTEILSPGDCEDAIRLMVGVHRERN